jgi:hypothetical protein
MLRERIKAITWVLDFIHIDLEQLNEAEVLKVGIDLQQNLLTDTEIFPTFTPSQIKAVHGNLKSFFEKYLTPVLQGKRKKSPPLPSPPVYKCRRFYISQGSIYLGESGNVSLEDVAVERFIKLLGTGEAIGLNYFQSCEHCHHWFFNSREKRFCSPPCNWKFNAEQRRGLKGSKQRKAYNKHQAEIKRKQYAKKKTAQGPKGKT